MTIQIYKDLEQGTLEWHQARCGIVTASQICEIITEKNFDLSKSKGAKEYIYELVAQKITGRVDIANIGYNGMRGHFDEEKAKELYGSVYEPITEVGFVTNDALGFTIGFSPDGLVGNDGFIECKGRLNKFQVRTILEDGLPDEFLLQVLGGFIVTERKWCDFISFSNGLNMYRHRYYPDEKKIDLLKARLVEFHDILNDTLQKYIEKTNTLEFLGDLIAVEYEPVIVIE